MRVYCDSVILIYMVEGVIPFRTRAVEWGCDRFLTNDVRLSRFEAILIEVLP